jgi:hypothetical protein
MHSPLQALTPGIAAAPLKVGPFSAFDDHSETEESICMSLFWCLMNGCTGFVNALIAEVNISQLTNRHHLIFFPWKQLSREKTFRSPRIIQRLSNCTNIPIACYEDNDDYKDSHISSDVDFLKVLNATFAETRAGIFPKYCRRKVSAGCLDIC